MQYNIPPELCNVYSFSPSSRKGPPFFTERLEKEPFIQGKRARFPLGFPDQEYGARLPPFGMPEKMF
jgi:hypothetical protein